MARTASRRKITPSPLDIPSCLRLTAAQRRQSWDKHPPQPMPLYQDTPRFGVDPAVVAEFKAIETRKKANKVGRARAAQKIDYTRMRWDAVHNKFVPMATVAPPSTNNGAVLQQRLKEQGPRLRLARKVDRHAGIDDLAAQVAKYVTGATGIDLKKLKKLAKANDVWNDKYASLNNGLQRMNVVNRLRGKVKKTGYKVVWP